MKYNIIYPAGKNLTLEFCLFVLLLMSAIPAVFGTCTADNDNNFATGMLTLISSKEIISNGSEPSETHKLPFDLWYKNDYPDGDIIITKEVQVVDGNTVDFYYQIEYTLDPNEEPTSYTIEENGWEKTIYRVSLPCLVNTGRADKGTDDDGHITYTIEYFLIERTVVDPRLKPPDQSFNITVTLTDKGDGTIAPTELTVRDIEGQKKTYTDEENFNNGIFVGEFQNELRSDSAPFTVPVVKKLEGRAPKVGDEWTFTITAVCEKEGKYVECENKEDKGPLPEPNYVKGTVTGEDPIRFGPVKFTANQLGPCSMTGTGSYTCDPKDFIYKVTETGDVSSVDTDGPKYFTVTVSLDPNGDIQAEVKGTADLKKLLTFTNTYTPEGFLRIRGMKYLSGMDLKKGQFSFVLLDKDNGIMELKSNDESGSFIFEPIEFTKEGTYLYTVKEYGCEDKNGITCDKTEYVIQAKVSYDDNTKKFEVGTKKVFRCPEDRDDDEECIETDLDTTKLDFTNKYQPKGSIQFSGTKTLSGMDLEKDQFSFVLLDKDGEVLQTVKNKADGSIIFEPIEFTKAGTYLYTVKESGCEDGNGLTCDKTEHKITVTVTNNQDGTLIPETDIDVTKLDFTNKYQAEGSIQFGGTKILNGMDLAKDRFSFVLLDEDGEVLQTVKNDADGRFIFEIEFTKDGTYRYTVKESGCEDGHGITCDNTKYNITVTVTDNRDGTLTAQPDIDVTKLDFTNKYQPEGKALLRGNKILDGMDLKEGQFSFVLLDKDGEVLQTATNEADGHFDFEPGLYYTKPGTYTYTIKEYGCENKDGITCDTTVYEITATATDNRDGTLTLSFKADVYRDGTFIETVSLDVSGVDFTNEYNAEGSIQFGGTKILNGMDLEKGQFGFVLLDKDGEVLQTAENEADSSFIFEPIEFTDEGTYRYTVKESGCTDGNGLTCDKTEYNITVTVTDNRDGTLTAQPDIDVTKLDFTNNYQAEGSIQFAGTNTLIGKDPTQGPFSFDLLDENGNVLETVENSSEGRIIFRPISFTKAGIYRYTVKESGCRDGDGLTCDKTEYSITVTVTDNRDGTLTAQPNIDVSSLNFINIYTANGSILFSGKKTMTGKDLEKGQFGFVLLDEDGEVLQTATNDADGSFIFEPIEFMDEGTYRYTVKESGCTDGNGLTCDKTEYSITVTVTENSNGTLTAKADIDVSKLNFTNTYNNKRITPTPHTPIQFERLPETGFPTLRTVTLPAQPKKLSYRPMEWTLEIPTLSLSAEIVEVPSDGGNYPVTWLGSAAGLLEGSAMPGDGRSILTGHNHLNLSEAGPFSQLWTMDPGDRIFILDPQGELQIFTVTANEKIAEDDVSGLLRITERHPRSLTLITCEDERPNGTYANRRIISAVPY